MKNSDARLYQELKVFTSATRFLITGTPLQNEMKELWSLLHFLLPSVFKDWEAFDSYFDFTGLEDEEGTESFITDEEKQELMRKIHIVLQPLMLRRVKADVASHLPPKREYILYAPLTKEQTDLYKAISDRGVDTRAYLSDMVARDISERSESLSPPDLLTPLSSRQGSVSPSVTSGTSRKGASDKLSKLPTRESPRKKKSAVEPEAAKPSATDAFALMMGKRGRGRPKKISEAPAVKEEVMKDKTESSRKRKGPATLPVPEPKSYRSSRESTPGSSRRTRAHPGVKIDAFANVDEDKLDDDEFEARLIREYESQELSNLEEAQTAKDFALASSFELASTCIPFCISNSLKNSSNLLSPETEKEVARKKLGNPIMQLRLVCNSPHNFYNPWTYSDDPVDETVVTKSGKMLLLDRLLPALFKGGHKVLIFSQFKTQLDILEDYCNLREYNFCRLDGSVSHEARRDMISQFNTDEDTKVFLLSTRAGGQGINLMAADTVILFDRYLNPPPPFFPFSVVL